MQKKHWTNKRGKVKVRPHSSLGNLTPSEFARAFAERESADKSLDQ